MIVETTITLKTYIEWLTSINFDGTVNEDRRKIVFNCKKAQF